eukprot:11107752-Karenia_brevis.AAC.1
MGCPPPRDVFPEQDLAITHSRQDMHALRPRVVLELLVRLIIAFIQDLSMFTIHTSAARLGSMEAGFWMQEDWEELDIDDQVDVIHPPRPGALHIIPSKLIALSNVLLGQPRLQTHGVEIDASSMHGVKDRPRACPATGSALEHSNSDFPTAFCLHDHVLHLRDQTLNLHFCQHQRRPPLFPWGVAFVQEAGDSRFVSAQELG